MERITRMPEPGRRGWTTVEYKYEEAQYQIVMIAKSELPLDHASFQTVLGCFASLERLPSP
jgi:hypothetical protein